MITKKEMIEIIKAENPTIQIGDEQGGYTELSSEEYELQIVEWADARLEKITRLENENQARLNKIAAYEKLGLTEAEIEALLPTPTSLVRPTASA
jgi:Tfp pilus assembly protein PilN